MISSGKKVERAEANGLIYKMLGRVEVHRNQKKTEFEGMHRNNVKCCVNIEQVLKMDHRMCHLVGH